MEKEKSVIRSLMDVQIEEPETMDVSVPRLDLVLTLREIPYDKVVSFAEQMRRICIICWQAFSPMS